VDAIRERARVHVDDGAVTEGYQADRKAVLQILDEALATELVCMLRYRRHYFMSASLGGIHGFAVGTELLKHADQELAHADRLAERIVQLGGQPNFDPDTIAERSHAEYSEGADLSAMLREDLVAERIAIETYGELIRYLGPSDPTTRRLLEDILAQEEEHADDLADFLRGLPRDAERAPTLPDGAMPWEGVREAFRAKLAGPRTSRPADSWESVEPALRFGYDARQRQPSASDEWDSDLEARLQQEWDTLSHSAADEPRATSPWYDVRQFVHRGWLGP
jgi:bacterioferritin